MTEQNVTVLSDTLPPLPRVRRLSLRLLLALGLLVATDALLIVDIVVWAGQRFRPPPVSFIGGQAIFVGEMFFAFAYGVMGWLLATRVSRNPLGWLFQIMGLGMAAQMGITFLVEEGHQAFRPLDSMLLIGAWAGSSVHLPSLIVCFSFVFAFFPHGSAVSRRWAVGPLLSLIGSVFVIVSIGFSRDGLIWYPSLPNPFAAPEGFDVALAVIGVVGVVGVVLGVLISAASILVRYRMADSDEKAQVRWIGMAVLLLAGSGLPFVIARYALRMDYATGELLLSVALAAGCFLPVAAAVAVLRHRLYDIDVIINRALVYIPLTALLGGLYAGGVALFQKAFLAVTGDRSDAAVVITTLVLAGLFTPIKNGLQSFVDRRFKPVKPGHHTDESPLDSLSERLSALEQKVNQLAG